MPSTPYINLSRHVTGLVLCQEILQFIPRILHSNTNTLLLNCDVQFISLLTSPSNICVATSMPVLAGI